MNIAENFSKSAHNYPHRTAIVSGDARTSYADLYAAALGLAHQLQHLHADAQKPVAILATKQLALVQCVLGAALAGRTFFILDESYPSEKLMSMCHVAQPATLLHTPQSRSLAAAIGAASPGLRASLAVDGTAPHRPSNPSWAVQPPDPSLPAYLLFTSGTTGVPKCIQIGHEPLNHFVSWYVATFQPDAESNFSMLSGIGHDPVFRDLFVPLAVGAALHIPPKDFNTKPKRAFQWLLQSRVGYMHLTPQMAKVIALGAGVGQCLPDLKYAFFGGDTLTTQHVQAMGAIAPQAQWVNFYGASETPQAMGYHRLAPDDVDPIPLGIGIDGVDLQILRPDLSRADFFEVGQIAISTRYLAMGYLGDDKLSQEKFVRLDNASTAGDVVTYLTGDRGYRRDDHRIISSGRTDDQVKVRGFRVELSEVNANLLGTDLVHDAVTLALPDGDGETRLVAFFKPKEQAGHADHAAHQLKRLLETQLPAYAVPGMWIQVDAMPLLPNGKIDRQALRDLHTARTQAVEGPAGPAGSDPLIAEFQKILGVAHLDPALPFSELGADSLSYIRASIVLEKHLGHAPAEWENIPLEDLLALKKEKTGYFSTMGTTVFIRAVSIVLVLMDHFKIINIPGSTTLLLFITGWSIGKYQLTPITKHKSPLILLNTFAYIAIPTFCINAFVIFKNSASVDWPSLLLINNLTASPFAVDGYWYLNVLLQSLLIIMALLSVPPWIEKIEANGFKFFSWMALISIVLAAADFFIQNQVPVLSPVQKIWVIFIGICFALAKSTAQRRLVFLLILTMGFDQYNRNGFSVMPIAFAWFAVAVAKVQMPTVLVKAISHLAGASLFIYLTHLQVKGLVDKTAFAGNKPVYLLAALVGGVIMWRAWDTVYEPLKRRIRLMTDSKVNGVGR